MKTGRDVRRVRRANRMTQQQLADHFGVTRRTVIRWEQQGVGWNSYAFHVDKFHELEQPGLPL